MKLLSLLVVVLGLQASQAALGASLFRCEYNGRVEFSDRPCQPAKPQSLCVDRDGRSQPPAQCSAPGLDAGKPAILAPAATHRSGSTVDLPTRLALTK